MVKYASSILIFIALIFAILSEYGFEHDYSERIVSSIVHAFNFSSPPEINEPSMQPTPFYQIRKTATYILVLFSFLTAISASIIEIRQLVKVGKNNHSAAILAIGASIFYFNINVVVWNT